MIQENFERIKNSLNERTNLLAVSKTKPIEAIKDLYLLGQRDFGENKVQELFEKANALIDLDINWHFIGHLQTNKINQLLKTPGLKYIHSIDRISLVEKLLSKTTESKVNIFIQINTSGEMEKGGLETVEEVKNIISKFQNNSFFKVVGLMTMGKIRTENFEADARTSFSKLKSMRDEIDPHLQLSMGMSQDYQIAMDYGANWVRIGSSLFGARK